MREKSIKNIWLIITISSFIWIIPFSVLLLIDIHFDYGIFGLMEGIIAFIAVTLLTPWRFPNTKLWKLFIAPYIFFILSILFVLYVLIGYESFAQIQYGVWLFPCFVPFFTLGYKTWNSIISARDNPMDIE